MNPTNSAPLDKKKYPVDDIAKKKVGLVLSGWNRKVIDTLRDNCIARLLQLGFPEENITEFQVPGSFELPWGAKQLIKKGGFDGIICFGCVIKGETKHDEYINHAVTKALMGLNLTVDTPVLFGVLTTNTLDQAIDRANGKKGNKGRECADALIKMLSASQQLNKQKSKIGF